MGAWIRRARAAALAGALVLAACGDDAPSRDEARPLGEELAGSVAPLAQCADWRAGNRARRLATIDEIQRQINLEDAAVKTPRLSDRAAYRILESTCSKPFAKGFRLYKVYARAASFAPFAED